MKNKIVYYCCILLFPVVLEAQTIIRVVDGKSGDPIPFVFAKLNNQRSFVSDETGRIEVALPQAAEMIFTHVAFLTKTVEIPAAGELDVQLERSDNTLAEVVVSSFESERPLLVQAAGVVRVAESELARFNETSVVHAFNTKPGVRVEERAPASYRISIRGSSLRSPFGVRNIKVYWNDIPFTGADGTTPLNILDLSNIENTEIIKGPAGSIYGAGNGGVISFSSKQQVDENRISTDLSAGDFGLVRYRLGVQQQLENGGISVSYAKQKADGYRDHTAMDREVFQMAGTFNPSDKQRINTQLLYSDLFYQLPGALTAAQRDENPRQARPGSASQNASIAQKSMYGTIGHEYLFSPQTANRTSFYINTTDFENPFNLDYKKETQFSYGGRTSFTHNGTLGAIPVRLIAGGEYQLAKAAAQNFGNRNGVADTIRFSDDLITSTAFLFQQIEAELTERLLLTLGLSENFSNYNISRNIDALRRTPSSAQRRFDPVVVPRIALSAKLSETSAVHGSISSGFSPPTIDEVRTNEGSINLDLEAEKGINYEVGYRSSYANGMINLDVSAFYFQLDETITTFTNEQGVVLFRNAGATDQKGIEGQVDYFLIRNQLGFVQELKLTHAYTGHYFTFSNFVSGGNDFSGNNLTGVAPHTVVNKVDLRTRLGLYANFTHQFVDEIPLNDANTVHQEAYHLVNARIGWRRNLGIRWDLEVFAGAENLLNEAYSLGNDLNAFGGRFFQPAATRNYYGGIKMGMKY
ncbi:TonB-dependent receptor [Lunatimonas lonarensis]|uniref:TonB-dependent receptor n=1 Tax=Lunatimonas lonarensis TaxID=1232681 RepID=R7ZT94_9BACT|nr:TonB-dependent receptor [Lunatimonas lonarensis]EON77371.1 TonB-dependent receptor [Lunatimonas lonarensis]